VATRIQIRRDTLNNWTSNNPVLSSGEISFVTDLNRIKVGDGVQNWLDLGYLEADAFIGSVIMGVDTEGNYVETVIAGDGVSVSGADAASASVTVTNEGVLSLSGTTNEIEVSASTGSIAIGLPSTIHANVQGNVTGNSDSASALATPRTISLGGDVSGSVSFDGSSDVTITANIEPDSVALGTDTTGNYVSQVTGSGNGISVSGSGESASVTIENTGVHSLVGTENEVSVSASSGSVTVSLPESVTIQSELNVLGNLTVSGSTTTINTQTLVVEDKNIEIGNVEEPTDITANGGGITLKGATDKTFNWIDATDSWTSSENIDLADGKVIKHNGTEILSSVEYTGNAATSTKLNSPQTIALSGDLSGSVSFDGSASVSIDATIQPDSVVLGTDTTGNYVATIAGTANQITVSGSGSENAEVTLSLPSTIDANTTGSAAKLTTERAIALTGDVTGTANFDGSASAGISTTLSNTAVTPASYGSASAVGTFTVDAKGRLTAASSTPIAIAQSAVTNLTTDLGLKANLASPTFTGVPIAPTAAPGTNTTQIATTAYVQGELGGVQPTIHPMFIIGGV
jgi:hypothetical protein